ncbi:MAG TPA: TetR/AcrR family transcriptional regulator [Lacisediminihabitans sp.]|uniref:TetR/AcrR family transcriptional regulator n=1 Tax=Lacisediminihabitans sp. TaxID=2787631 RepID=UPI002ED8972B
MSDPTSDGGLRERKRAALYASIERTAIDLALEHGYENTTIDMICEAGMISQRTFFNYFGSKEGVILGATPPMPSQEEIDDFAGRTGSNVLGDFVAMITASFVEKELDADLFRARRLLIQRTPELHSKELARMGDLEEQFVRIVLTRFRAQGRSTATSPDLEDEARMVVDLTTGVMRFAMHNWFSADFSGTVRELLGGSIDLIRRITDNTPSS